MVGELLPFIKNIQPILDLSINKIQVCVYFVDLAFWEGNISLFWGLLCEQERNRVNEFYFETSKLRFIVSRGMLRILLSYYTNISSSNIDFCTNKYGKLFLKNYPELQFNMSYSNKIICYAFTLFHPLGVDVEWKNPDFDISTVIEFVLTPTEQKFFMGANLEEKSSIFYEIWSKKEALVKAIGVGLSYPIHTIDVIHVNSMEPIYLKTFEEENRGKQEWYVYPINELSGYSCAIATDDKLSISNVSCKHI